MGRSLLSLIFIVSACSKLLDTTGVALQMEAHGIPYAPLMLTLAILAELLGGLAILTGVCARPFAVLLIFYLIPVTYIYHNFWSVPGEMVMAQAIETLKNLAIMGGLFMVAAFGAGPVVVEVEKPSRKVVVLEADDVETTKVTEGNTVVSEATSSDGDFAPIKPGSGSHATVVPPPPDVSAGRH